MRRAAMCVLLASCIIPAQPRGGGGYGGGGGPAGDPSTGAPPPGGETESTGGGGGGAAAPGPVSVDIHSHCAQTVHVFYGDKPKFGSGTYSTIESNSIESHTFNPGEQMWIVDESQNGIAGTSVGPGIHEIDIPETCTSLIAQ